MTAATLRTPPSRWVELRRVLVYTLAVALGFVALGRIELALFGVATARQWLERDLLIGSRDDAALGREAGAIAAASRDALARLPAGHRVAALRVGYEVGYASYLLAGYIGSPEAARIAARRAADSRIALARALAAPYGIDGVAELPVRNLKEFTELNRRLDAEETGLAAQVSARMSPLHRELYLLGVQLGTEAARIEGSGGRMSLPPAALIRRHATLAGIAPALWEPLAEQPRADTTPDQVKAHYGTALNALAATLL